MPKAFTMRTGMWRWLAMLVLLVLAQAATAQTQQQLEQRRKRLEQRIASTSKQLELSAKDRAAALDRLLGLQRQIVQREELIEITRLQLQRVDSSLVRTQSVMLDLEGDISSLTVEYGKLARAALRQGLLNHRLAFLLSASSVNDAFLRAQYLRRYDANRRRQLELIASTRQSLEGKLTRLNELRAEKSALIGEEITQQSLREGELVTKNELIANLSGSELKLKEELEDALRDKAQLDNAIAEVIDAAREAEERRRKNREAEATAKRAREAEAATRNPKRDGPVASAPKPATREMVRASDYSSELSAEFVSNRGQLPWPVEKGYVSKPFGRQPHPTIKRVEINNNGVDIRTTSGAEVQSIFDGEVVGMQSVPGYNTMVIVQHGDYYTVYSNLTDVRVKRGARVGTREVLGYVAGGGGGETAELHFEIWRGKTAQSPNAWVRGLQ